MPRPPRDLEPLPVLRQSANREEGIAAFEADLEAAAATFAKDPTKGKLAAVSAVILLLDDGGLPKQWIAPFRAVLDDLVDATRAPAELKRQDWIARAKIGAALDVQLNKDEDEVQAAGEVAKVVNECGFVVREADGSTIWIDGPWVSRLRRRLLRQKSRQKSAPGSKPRANPEASVVFDYYRQLWHQQDVLKLLKEHLAGQT